MDTPPLERAWIPPEHDCGPAGPGGSAANRARWTGPSRRTLIPSRGGPVDGRDKSDSVRSNLSSSCNLSSIWSKIVDIVRSEIVNIASAMPEGCEAGQEPRVFNLPEFEGRCAPAEIPHSTQNAPPCG